MHNMLNQYYREHMKESEDGFERYGYDEEHLKGSDQSLATHYLQK